MCSWASMASALQLPGEWGGQTASLWCPGGHCQRYPGRRDSLVSNSSLCVLGWACYYPQIHWTLAILYGTWRRAPFPFWFIRGNVPCSCAWYWRHYYPYPDRLASLSTTKASGGYRYYPQTSPPVSVWITQTLRAAIQEPDSPTRL